MKANFALVTLATVAFGCVTAAQKADQIHESPWQPFEAEGVSSCNAETYAFVGSIKLHERIVETGLAACTSSASCAYAAPPSGGSRARATGRPREA